MYKLLSIIILIIYSISIISCDSNDEPNIEMNPSDLLQTTWFGVDNAYKDDQVVSKTDFILEFLTESTGTYIFVNENGEPYGNGNFQYKIDGRIITFSGAIVGNWTIIEKSNKSITLQSFLPEKHIIILTQNIE